MAAKPMGLRTQVQRIVDSKRRVTRLRAVSSRCDEHRRRGRVATGDIRDRIASLDSTVRVRGGDLRAESVRRFWPVEAASLSRSRDAASPVHRSPNTPDRPDSARTRRWPTTQKADPKVGLPKSCLHNSVELRGLEPLTPCMPCRCATSCATAPRSCDHALLRATVIVAQIGPDALIAPPHETRLSARARAPQSGPSCG